MIEALFEDEANQVLIGVIFNIERTVKCIFASYKRDFAAMQILFGYLCPSVPFVIESLLLSIYQYSLIVNRY